MVDRGPLNSVAPHPVASTTLLMNFSDEAKCLKKSHLIKISFDKIYCETNLNGRQTAPTASLKFIERVVWIKAMSFLSPSGVYSG